MVAGSQLDARSGRLLVNSFSRTRKYPPGTLGERRGAHGVEQFEGGEKLFAGVAGPFLPSGLLPEQQMGVGRDRSNAGSGPVGPADRGERRTEAGSTREVVEVHAQWVSVAAWTPTR
jgi:hypothetical protein